MGTGTLRIGCEVLVRILHLPEKVRITGAGLCKDAIPYVQITLEGEALTSGFLRAVPSKKEGVVHYEWVQDAPEGEKPIAEVTFTDRHFS